MPKRIIDGEAYWSSSKVGLITPEWMRAEYAVLLPLALANGTFELNSRLIWGRVYATNRPSITPEKVRLILAEMQRVKLLFPFEAAGKRWGYWVGIDAPGRLPCAARRGFHEKTGPPVPEEELQRFLTDTNGMPTDSNGMPADSAPNHNPNPNPKHKPRKPNTPFPDDFAISESAFRLAESLGLEAEQQLPAFRDHHKSKGSRFADWNLAFHTWLRNAIRFGAGRRAPGGAIAAQASPQPPDYRRGLKENPDGSFNF